LPFPKALLGKGIHDVLKKSLKERATYYAAFLGKHPKIDRYVQYDESSGGLKATANSADARDKKTAMPKYRNHIVFQAEPQIGKTGTYLPTIGTLRKKISADESIEIDDDSEEESEEESDKNQIQSADQFNDSVAMWKFPYWKKLQEVKFKMNPSKRKYDRFNGGPFVYPGKPPKPITRPSAEVNARRSKKPRQVIDQTEIESLKSMKFVAHYHTHSCIICPSDSPSELLEVIFGSESLKVSVPSFKKPFQKLKNILAAQKKNERQIENSDSTIWIMTPSYGRSDSARLNLNHMMVDAENKLVPYVHIIFVRKDEFDIYCRIWKHSHGLIVLPNKMDDCDETAESGGIGYSRRFIQCFAEYFGISNYLVNDDNIRGYLTFKEKNDLYHREKETEALMTKETTLANILNTFTTQSKCDAGVCELPEGYAEHEGYKHPCLAAYTGPWKNYGIIGMQKFRPYTHRIQNPFSKSHIASSVFFNGKVLAEKGIKFSPWLYREDLQFNCEVVQSGLEVVKYNRFLVVKVSITFYGSLVL